MTTKPLSAREMMRGRKHGYQNKKEYVDKLFSTNKVQIIRTWTHKEPFTMEIEVIKDGTRAILDILGAIDDTIRIIENGKTEVEIIHPDNHGRS